MPRSCCSGPISGPDAMVAVRLNGFFPPDYAGGPFTAAVGAPPPGGMPQYAPTEIGDARVLQGDADPAAFLAEHGFVLVPHVTQVRDWDSDVANVYLPEID